MYNNAIKGRGAFGAGGAVGGHLLPDPRAHMTFGARALGYLAVPQQIGYPGS